VEIKPSLIYIFLWTLSKIGIHHVWSWNASTTNNYNILVPLQIVDIIETLKNLHHKLLAEIVNILTMRCIIFLFFAQSLMASPKRKVFKLSPNPNVQLVDFTTWISWVTRWRNIIHPLHHNYKKFCQCKYSKNQCCKRLLDVSLDHNQVIVLHINGVRK